MYLWPNISVERVSCSLNDEGEQQMMMVVLALPPVKKSKCIADQYSKKHSESWSAATNFVKNHKASEWRYHL